MKQRIDWSKPQHCRVCLRPMRNRRVRSADAPGTVALWSDGACEMCAKRMQTPKAHRSPTVRELAAAGQPCISPAPMPSRVRSYPL